MDGHRHINLMIKFINIYRKMGISKHNFIHEEALSKSTSENIHFSAKVSKLIKVAVIGVPNSGKSTLVNGITETKVCSVSRKVHTTQINARAVVNHEKTQIVFLDTPGIVTVDEAQRYALNQPLIAGPELSIQNADLIAVLHDASNRFTRNFIHPRILRLLALYSSVPSVLLLNKIDKIKDKRILLSLCQSLTKGILDNVSTLNVQTKTYEYETKSDLEKKQISPENSSHLGNEISINTDSFPVENSFENNCDINSILNGSVKPTEAQIQNLVSRLKHWPQFQEIFMVSSLNGLGITDFKNYLLVHAKESEWLFDDNVTTDQSAQDLTLACVRSKCLEFLSHNIPYEIKYKIMHWQLTDSDMLNVMIGINCSKKNLLKLIIGPSGSKIKTISQAAEQELRNIFRIEVGLKLNVSYVKNP